ncbi:hypothetical protein HYQ46_012960 [Verticillium longisporum]|nr:hypothetical protein HYQ46_012960 [Verticillium longisporum]
MAEASPAETASPPRPRTSRDGMTFESRTLATEGVMCAMLDLLLRMAVGGKVEDAGVRPVTDKIGSGNGAAGVILVRAHDTLGLAGTARGKLDVEGR